MENKAHQDDFYVLDVSLAQTLHKLLLSMNSQVPKWNPYAWVLKQERSRQATFASRSELLVRTGFASKPTPRFELSYGNCSHHFAPSSPSLQRAGQSLNGRRAQWESPVQLLQDQYSLCRRTHVENENESLEAFNMEDHSLEKLKCFQFLTLVWSRLCQL